MAPKKAKAEAKKSQPKAQAEAPKDDAEAELKDEPKEELKEEVKEETPKEETQVKQDVDMEATKGDVVDDAAQEESKPEDKDKEMEEDAAADKRSKVKQGSVTLNFDDATLNAMPVHGGKVLMSLTEGGMQYLLASARCNAGIKAGRYMFEVRILETLNPVEHQGHNRPPGPRQLVKVGFSLGGSSLFMGDGASNCCFDSEGFFVHDKTRKRTSGKFYRDQTVAVLLNVDASLANANTVSLFVNGVRATEPIPLPEALQGKPLYPTVTYKNVSLEVNLGPAPRAPLPFTCNMVAAAAAEDLEIPTLVKRKDGKGELVLPVGLPDTGYFDWVDKFLAENPGFVELSDRKILEWASKSGIWKARVGSGGSSDKPEANTGVPAIDDWSVSRVIAAVAPTLPRNYIVPELKANLVKSDREEALLRFTAEDFHRKAVVLMGDPDQPYKEFIQKLLLEEKKVQAEAERRKKAQEAERKRQQEERKRKAEAARKSYEAAKRRRMGEEVEEPEEAEEKPEEEEEAKPVEEEEKEEEPEEPVELTEEDKALKCRKLPMPDMAERELARSYASFALPEKSEGFDEVTFVWDKESSCASLLKSWVLEKKQTQRAEDLVPGADFKAAMTAWQKAVQDWRKMQADFRDPGKRRAAKEKRLEEARQKIEEEKKTLIEAGDEEGAKALEQKAEEPEEEIDTENLDVLAVEDIKDIGNGEPLFGQFQYEDWTLLSTRYELHILVHSFKKDLNDPDRPSFHLKHLAFYYQKYFRKPWNFQQFGIKEFDDLVELLKDSVSVDSAGHLKADESEDTPLERFVKLTEDNRRERQRRIDAGDETARLKFSKPTPQAQKGNDGGKGGYGKGGKNSYGGGGGGGGSYGQKRPYNPPPAPSYKQTRSTYGGGSYGGGGGGYNSGTRGTYGR